MRKILSNCPVSCFADEISVSPVSYTHLDVYKRQVWGSHNKNIKADYFLERPADLLSAITSS